MAASQHSNSSKCSQSRVELVLVILLTSATMALAAVDCGAARWVSAPNAWFRAIWA